MVWLSATMRTLNTLRLPPLPTVRDLVKLYKLQAIKQLSQNFIMDERLTSKIVRCIGRVDPRDVILEVGPGPGSITRSILKHQPSRLILVEKDKRFQPTLELLREAAMPFGVKVDIFYDDILQFPVAQHLPDYEARRLHLVGNLPFAISTRLLINWLEDISLWRGAFRRRDTCMTLTFQKEVAERICATAGSEQRSRLSVMSQIWTQPVLKFIIPGKAFVPKPEVDVGVVKLIPLKQPKTDLPFGMVEKVIRHVFNMRQKFCRRGYSTLFPSDIREDVASELLRRADVEGTLRPFQLTVDEYLRLTAVYLDYLKEHPQLQHYDYRGPKILREANYSIAESV